MKFKSMYLVIFAVALTLALSAPAACMAEPCPDKPSEGASHQRGENMKRDHEKLFKELGLNEEQRTRLDENKKNGMESMRAVFSQIDVKMKELNQELGKDQLDMGKVNKINTELKNLNAQMQDDRLRNILEVRKILTPEQFKKFTEKMGSRKGHPEHMGKKTWRDKKCQ